MFDWRDLLPLAERIAAEGDGEAAQRTAINRAYYAAYHVAAHVRATGMLPGRHSHRQVRDALARDVNRERADIGRQGDLLRQTRIAADYATPFPGDVSEQVRVTVATARAIIEALDQLS